MNSRFFVSCTALILFASAGIVYYLTGERDTLYASCLLFLPVTQILSFHFLSETSKLRTLSLLVITFSGLLHFASWLVYSLLVSPSPYSQVSINSHPKVELFADYLSRADLVWSFVMITFACYLTSLILNGTVAHFSSAGWKGYLATRLGAWSDEVRNNIKDHPIFSVALIFTLFLHVTYALGFSLALHDKREGGLYVNPVPRVARVGHLLLPRHQEDVPDNTLLFRRLRKAVEDRDHGTVRIVIEGAVAAKGSGTGEGRRREYSIRGVEEAVGLLGSQLRVNGTSRVEWLFETAAVQGDGAGMWPNADPGAIEQDGRGSAVQGIPRLSRQNMIDPNEQNVARLKVTAITYKGPDDTELIDYVNFIVYTMVTTGYGDLVPVSPFSKMICAFANIFELFFTMIFFAVFLSFIGPWRQPPSRPKPAQVAPGASSASSDAVREHSSRRRVYTNDTDPGRGRPGPREEEPG